MDKSDITEAILETKLITIIRTDYPEKIFRVAEILLEVDLPVLEITSNTPNYLDHIQRLRSDYPQLIIGAGTITDPGKAEDAIDAGAMFLVTPNTSKNVLDCAKRKDRPVAMGAFSPTEIHNAVQWGADFIKLFPADYLGPKYLKAVQATLSNVKFVPTGGVRTENIGEWIRAGASAFGIGGGIVSNTDLAQNDFEGIKKKATLFKDSLLKYE